MVAVPNELKAARAFLVGLPERLEGRSLLVHVEGWREVHEGQRIHMMSRDLMEVTRRLRRPVIPVRFSGGLPAAPVGYKFHLPYRMGRLAITMAPPIEPESLADAAVAGATPPHPGRDQRHGAGGGVYAGRPNAALAKRCLRRHVETGSSALKCFLLEALETMPDPSPETRVPARLHPHRRAAAARRGGPGLVRAPRHVDHRRARR